MFSVVLVLQMLLQFSGPFLINNNPLYPVYEIVLIFHRLHTFKLRPFFRKLEKDHVFQS